MKHGAQAQYNFHPKERTEKKVSRTEKIIPKTSPDYASHCSLFSLPHFNFKFDVVPACCQRQHSWAPWRVWSPALVDDHVLRPCFSPEKAEKRGREWKREKKKSKQLNLNHAPSITSDVNGEREQQMLVIVRKANERAMSFRRAPQHFCGWQNNLAVKCRAQSHGTSHTTVGVLFGEFVLNYLIILTHLVWLHNYSMAAQDVFLCCFDVGEVDATATVINENRSISSRDWIYRCRA